MHLKFLILLCFVLAVCSARQYRYRYNHGDPSLIRRTVVSRRQNDLAPDTWLKGTYTRSLRRNTEPVEEARVLGQTIVVPHVIEDTLPSYADQLHVQDVSDPVVYVEEPEEVPELPILPEELTHIETDHLIPIHTDPHIEPIVGPSHEREIVHQEPIFLPVHPEQEILLESTTPKPQEKLDLSIVYDYIYPIVLRKCLISFMQETIPYSRRNNDVNYLKRMTEVYNPLVQVAGLDTLEQIRANFTLELDSSVHDNVKNTCVHRFSEINDQLKKSSNDLVDHYLAASSEEEFRRDSAFMIKYGHLFQREHLLQVSLRKLHALLMSHSGIYKILYTIEPEVDSFIQYYNAVPVRRVHH